MTTEQIGWLIALTVVCNALFFVVTYIYVARTINGVREEILDKMIKNRDYSIHKITSQITEDLHVINDNVGNNHDVIYEMLYKQLNKRKKKNETGESA